MVSGYTLKELDLNGSSLAFYSETSGVNTLSYYCTARFPEALITESVWKVLKVITVTATGNLAAGKSVLFAGWTPDYKYAVPNLATVSWLTYV